MWQGDRMPDVTLGLVSASGEPELVTVKIQSSEWELNFQATPEELISLSAVRKTDWTARQSQHVGECAGSAVHWTADGDTVTIMVGDDDETWDVAVMVPVAVVDRIVADTSAGRW